MLTISGKALGQRKPLFSDWSLPLPPELQASESGITLRDLLARIVTAEVEAFNTRQKDQQTLRALTSRQIQDAAKKGKIDMGGREYDPQNADREVAIAVALEAFQDGLFLVVIDEEEKKELDQQLYLKPESRVTFIRLTMLAGG
jgi:hypothetical protein